MKLTDEEINEDIAYHQEVIDAIPADRDGHMFTYQVMQRDVQVRKELLEARNLLRHIAEIELSGDNGSIWAVNLIRQFQQKWDGGIDQKDGKGWEVSFIK